MRFLPALFLLITPLLAGPVVTPKEGSKERTAILEAVRDPVEDALHQKVQLKVKHLKIQDNWAFLDALPRTLDGKAVSYAGTMYEDWVDDTDEVLWVLLRNKRGRWYIVEKIFFTAEATWADWPLYFRAPKEIFPKLVIE